MKNIAVFASGEGTNAECLMRRFRGVGGNGARVALVVTNKAEAGVVARARRWGVTVAVVPRDDWREGSAVVSQLVRHGVDAVVLAGFLLLLPPQLVSAYEGRIVNIHPSLIPLHSGRGMYGLHVHEDVLRSGDKETGITIHLVDGHYDHGRLLFQARCPVLPGDTPELLAERVHALEHEHYPRVLAAWLELLA